MVRNRFSALTKGCGWSFAEIVQHDIFDPLNMTHTFYVPPKNLREDVVVARLENQNDIWGVDINYYLFDPYISPSN